MKELSINSSESSEFIFYPTNKVVGVIDNPDDAQAALLDLQANGFAADDIDVLTGKKGAYRIDVTGEKHGLLARIVRSIEKLSDFEPVHIRRYEREMLTGHYCIGVTARSSDVREQVRKILRSYQGHFINYYGEFVIEELEP